MKFFSLLLGVFIFCTSQAQDSTVCIPNKVSRWFLEQNNEAILLRKQVVVKDQRIYNLRETINTKDLIIQSYQKDSTTYNNTIGNLNQQLIGSNIDIRRQRRLKIILTASTAALGAIQPELILVPVLIMILEELHNRSKK